METYTTNFGVMLGDQEAAIDKVEELKKFASSTPFAMEDLAEGTQTLLAFNVSSEDSTGILKQLGDIALGDSDKLGRLTTAFGKANSTGKLTGETMQQMIEAGFNPALVITQKTGESMAEFQKRLSAGAVGVDELKGAMDTATSTGGQFLPRHGAGVKDDRRVDVNAERQCDSLGRRSFSTSQRRTPRRGPPSCDYSNQRSDICV